jgi:2Fe-2S ferredoxin
MARVTYVDHAGAAVEVEIAVGENVMRGALYNGIEGITGECGGGLSCATCHCYVDDAWTEAAGGPSSEAEAELLESAAAEVRPTSRLSCQLVVTEALDGLVVHMPEHQF